jgi:hypothetical protein
MPLFLPVVDLRLFRSESGRHNQASTKSDLVAQTDMLAGQPLRPFSARTERINAFPWSAFAEADA